MSSSPTLWLVIRKLPAAANRCPILLLSPLAALASRAGQIADRYETSVVTAAAAAGGGYQYLLCLLPKKLPSSMEPRARSVVSPGAV
jgi:hypothetical protein